MKRKLFGALALCCAAAVPLFADGVGIGSDTMDDQPREAPAPEYYSPRIQALTAFIAALTEEDNHKQAEALIEVVKYDPARAELPLFYFSKAVTTPELARQYAPELFKLAEENPDDIIIAVHCAGIGKLAGSDQSQMAEILRRTLESYRTRDPEESQRTALNTVFAQYLASQASLNEFVPACEIIESCCIAPERFGARDYVPLFSAADFCFVAQFREKIGVADAGNAAELEKKVFEAISRLPVDNIEKARQLTTFYKRRRLNDKAVETAKKFFDAHPGNRAAQLLMLETATEAGDVETVDKLLAETAVSQRANGAYFRIISRTIAGDLEGAQKLLEEDKNKASRANMLLLILLRTKDYPAMLKLLTDKNLAGVNFGDTPMLLIMIAEKLRNPELLKRAAEIAGEASFEAPTMANAFGYVSAVLDQDLDQAEKMVQKAIDADPGNAAYLDSMAWVKFKQGKLEEATEWINRSLRNADPFIGAGVLLEHAGDIAAARRQPEEAKRYYRLALGQEKFDDELDPEAVAKKLAALEKQS